MSLLNPSVTSAEDITAALNSSSPPVINIWRTQHSSLLSTPHRYLDLLPPPLLLSLFLPPLLFQTSSNLLPFSPLASNSLWLCTVMNVCQRIQQLKHLLCPSSSSIPFPSPLFPSFSILWTTFCSFPATDLQQLRSSPLLISSIISQITLNNLFSSSSLTFSLQSSGPF